MDHELAQFTSDLGDTILATPADAILAADRDGVIRFWNPGAVRIFGFTREEAVGASLDLIIPERLRKRHWDGWDHVMATGETRYGAGDLLAVPAITKDGTAVLTYTPDKAFTAWTSYAFPFGLTIGGGARYSGEMKRGTDGAIGTPTFVEDYWVFDAVASYAVSDSLTLRLNANNLFDKEYVAGINKSGYRYAPGAPRNYLLTATFRF